MWLFIGRFKYGSLPRMINKEVLARYIYINLSIQLKNCLPWKDGKFITIAMNVEERGWVKAKILLTNC